jgi:hypothetical protein
MRAVLASAPSARVIAPPFAGEGCAELEGVDLIESVAAARSLAPSALLLRAGDPSPWPPDAEELASAAGFSARRE